MGRDAKSQGYKRTLGSDMAGASVVAVMLNVTEVRMQEAHARSLRSTDAVNPKALTRVL